MVYKKEIILASKSPRRKEILLKFGYKTRIIVPKNVCEVSLFKESFSSPIDVVLENAKRKANSVKVKDKYIISSDTIVILDNKQYGKPKDFEEAKKFLTELQGKKHEVFSSFCIKKEDELFLDYDVSHVIFKKLSVYDIEEYINKVHVLDKAGAYAIQDGGESIIHKLDGSFYTVMGLPIEKINKYFD